MAEKSNPENVPEETGDSPSDTLIVPPPNFRERLDAARRARENDIHSSVQIPLPPFEPADDDDDPTSPGLPVKLD